MLHVDDKSRSNSTLKMIVSRQKLFILFAVLSVCLYISLLNPATFRNSRSFVVDYEKDVFSKDGAPFDFVSGSLHYFRVPHQLWRDRLLKLRASGINVVSTYVAWNVHEPHEGVFNFKGDANLIEFIKIAQSLDLLVNIRPGPYICAEWDNGGIPYFVLGEPKNPIKLRSSDERYLAHVKRYYDVLLPKLKPLLYRNGGPIILAQIENEYGSDLTCDRKYKEFLYNLMKEHLGKDDVVYYTADGWDMHHLICGPIHDSDVLTTINFGTKTEHHDAYYRMRGFQKKGPLVNSEFYPGWLDHWSEPHQCRDVGFVNSQFIKMLASKLGKIYVNFYMFFGGTNFAFYAGANHNGGRYQPDPTTYDYDAPMSEAGDMTYKYQVLQQTISKYRPGLAHPSFAGKAKNSTKKGYGWVDLTEVLDFGRLKSLATCHHERTRPKTFSQLKQDFGFVLYEINEVQGSEMDVLKIADPRDSVSVFVDNYYVGRIYRNDPEPQLQIRHDFNKLSLLVENMGRVNYGPKLHDYKGIISDVYLDGEKISGDNRWEMWCLPLNNTDKAAFAKSTILPGPGSLFKGTFTVSGTPADTWAKLTMFSKGVLWVNDHNLGRFWTTVGPQKHLYIPSVWLREGENEVVVLEVERVPEKREFLGVEFVDAPDIGACHY